MNIPVANIRTGLRLKMACPCRGTAVENDFYRVDSLPTNSCLLHVTVEEATGCPTGSIVLANCESCGFIFNRAFEETHTEYSPRYEETQGFSPTFSRFHRELAMHLIKRYQLAGKSVIEIGCGKGEFLLLLAQLGKIRGIGVDPSARQDKIDGVEGASLVSLIPERFHERHLTPEIDCIVCKMTLEHIAEPAEFLRVIRQALGDGHNIPVFFQIPGAERIFETCAFEDIYFEHCNYFTSHALTNLFEHAGFYVLGIESVYDGQYLTIEAQPINEGTHSVPRKKAMGRSTADLIEGFSKQLPVAKERWLSIINDAKETGETILIWGSGSKAVSFMTSLKVGDQIDYVTDINPHRHGHFMPLTGHQILSPQEAAARTPSLVIAMNRIYKDEIQKDLAKLGLSPKLMCL